MILAYGLSLPASFATFFIFSSSGFLNSPTMKSRIFAPNTIGLIPYKSIVALKTIAHKVIDLMAYDSIPVLVTGLDEMKGLFLRHFSQTNGVISHIQEDFFEKTCVEILDKCKQFRFAVMDYYSARFKDRLRSLVRSKKLVSDLGEIIEATREGKVARLVLPTERKVFGSICFETGEYEIHQKSQKKNFHNQFLNNGLPPT
jgi:hypothetical protein